MTSPETWIAPLRLVAGAWQQGSHLLLVTSTLIFLGASAGRAWGLDALSLGRAGSRAQSWLRIVT